MALRIVRNRKPEPPPEPDKPKRRVRIAGKTPPPPAEPPPEPSGPKRRVRVAGRTPPSSAERPSSRRRSPAGGRPAQRGGTGSGGGWIKWAVAALFVAVAAIVLGVYAARPRESRRRSLAVPDHYRGRDVQDAITRSMGGKSMEEWCREQEKDNEMVQGRRDRRKGRTGR